MDNRACRELDRKCAWAAKQSQQSKAGNDVMYNYQPATYEAHSQLVLRLLCVFNVCIYNIYYLCIPTDHVRNNYITYIVAMRPYFNQRQQFRRLLCVATII